MEVERGREREKEKGARESAEYRVTTIHDVYNNLLVFYVHLYCTEYMNCL